jgi:hypothetical protein
MVASLATMLPLAKLLLKINVVTNGIETYVKAIIFLMMET